MYFTGLQPNEAQVERVLQLNAALQQRTSVLLTGASGSGKTTSYKILCQSLNKLHSRRHDSETVGDEIRPTLSVAGLSKSIPKVG